MPAQLLPWSEDANYFRNLLLHLSETVMLPKAKFELWNNVDTVYTIRSRNTNGPEIPHGECCLNFELGRIIQLNK
jgi:hypothetical protein